MNFIEHGGSLQSILMNIDGMGVKNCEIFVDGISAITGKKCGQLSLNLILIVLNLKWSPCYFIFNLNTNVAHFFILAWFGSLTIFCSVIDVLQY